VTPAGHNPELATVKSLTRALAIGLLLAASLTGMTDAAGACGRSAAASPSHHHQAPDQQPCSHDQPGHPAAPCALFPALLLAAVAVPAVAQVARPGAPLTLEAVHRRLADASPMLAALRAEASAAAARVKPASALPDPMLEVGTLNRDLGGGLALMPYSGMNTVGVRLREMGLARLGPAVPPAGGPQRRTGAHGPRTEDSSPAPG
jgi:hypothetical protein